MKTMFLARPVATTLALAALLLPAAVLAAKNATPSGAAQLGSVQTGTAQTGYVAKKDEEAKMAWFLSQNHAWLKRWPTTLKL